MQYKTIILELIQRNPPVHDQLRKERKLLATVEQAALELKASHEAWLKRLTQTQPDELANQAYCRAFEMALQEIEERLLPASQDDENQLASSLSPNR
jgi:hypothetical protein